MKEHKLKLRDEAESDLWADTFASAVSSFRADEDTSTTVVHRHAVSMADRAVIEFRKRRMSRTEVYERRETDLA